MPRTAVRTFLFADLRDYTVFVETRGDAAAAKLLQAFRRIVRAQVAAHEGAEIRTEGDKFYVVFERPGDAVRAALGIMRRARRQSEDHPELALHIGIGMHAGEAVEHGGGYVGSAVNVASRLADHALAGQILLSDTVQALVRTSAIAPMRDLGTWSLKGVGAPVRVHEAQLQRVSSRRALGPVLRLPAVLLPTPSAPGLVTCPDLVQREQPLAALLDHLRAAATGETRMVAVTGEGGIGKSRLCRELARIADGDGLYVLGGRSHGTADAPYEPFVAALRPYAGARGAEILRRQLGGLAAELRRLLPEVDLGAAAEDASLPAEERRDRALRAIELLLEDAASLRPVLLVLEDFQHADPASRDLLRHLSATLRAGVCIVFTYRSEDVSATHPLTALLSDLGRQRRLAAIALSPLDIEGIERMTRALLPGRARPELVRSLAERSEGVPFYVEELLKTALDDPAGPGDRLALPRTVRDSVQLRVARLVEERGQPVADLVEAAAVAETPLGYEILVRLSARAEEEAAADIAACVEAQLLERTPTQTQIYRFRHALTREAIASAIAPARLRRLHLRVAEVIEASEPAAEFAPLLARHFAAGGEAAKAVRYARLGAQAASAVGAFGAAADLLKEAASHAGGTDEERAVLEELAAASQAAGRVGEAIAPLLRARQLAEDAHDAAASARLQVRLASTLRMQGRRAEAIAATRSAIAALGGRPTGDLAEAIAALAGLYWAENDPRRAAEAARRALAIAEETGATRVVVSALTVLGAAEARLGESGGSETLQRAVRLGLEHGLNAEVAAALLEQSKVERAIGRWDAARAAAEEGLELARQHGLQFGQARLLSELGRIYFTQGRYREARTVAEQAIALAPFGTIGAITAQVALAAVLTMQGEYGPALALCERIAPEMRRADPDQQVNLLSERARALLGLRRFEEADAAARSAVDLALSAAPGLGTSAFLVALDVVEARRDAASVRDLISAFERHFAARSGPVIELIRLEMSAILDLCEGRDSAAAFARVAEAYAKLGVSVRALYRRASAAIARLNGAPRSSARSRQTLQELETLRAELAERGALRYAAAIDAALAGRRRPRLRPSPAPGVLPPRELRVAALIARGYTNRRIAAELSVSPSEATRLVASVLGKLGVSSRSQVASWAVQREGLQPAGAAT